MNNPDACDIREPLNDNTHPDVVLLSHGWDNAQTHARHTGCGLSSSPCLATGKDRRTPLTHSLTSSFHLSLFFTSFWQSATSSPVYAVMLSFKLLFCLCLLLPHFPAANPCKTVFAMQDDPETWPYHFNLRFLTVMRRSSYTLTTGFILSRMCS